MDRLPKEISEDPSRIVLSYLYDEPDLLREMLRDSKLKTIIKREVDGLPEEKRTEFLKIILSLGDVDILNEVLNEWRVFSYYTDTYNLEYIKQEGDVYSIMEYRKMLEDSLVNPNVDVIDYLLSAIASKDLRSQTYEYRLPDIFLTVIVNSDMDVIKSFIPAFAKKYRNIRKFIKHYIDNRTPYWGRNRNRSIKYFYERYLYLKRFLKKKDINEYEKSILRYALEEGDTDIILDIFAQRDVNSRVNLIEDEMDYTVDMIDDLDTLGYSSSDYSDMALIARTSGNIPLIDYLLSLADKKHLNSFIERLLSYGITSIKPNVMIELLKHYLHLLPTKVGSEIVWDIRRRMAYDRELFEYIDSIYDSYTRSLK